MSDFARTGNQRGIARALEVISQQTNLDPDQRVAIDVLTGLTEAGVPGALKSLTPEIAPGTTSTNVMANTAFTQAVSQHMSARRSGGGERAGGGGGAGVRQATASGATGPKGLRAESLVNFTSAIFCPELALVSPQTAGLGAIRTSSQPQATPTSSGTWETWVLGFDLDGRMDPTADVVENRFDTNGVSVGVGRRSGRHWIYGATAGLAHTKVKELAGPNDSSVDSFNAGFYGSYNRDRLYLDLQTGYTGNDVSTRRFIRFGPLDRVATADFDGRELYAYAEGSYALDLKRSALTVQPLLSLQARTLKEDAFRETGAGALSLTVNKRTTDLLQSGLGVRVARTYRTHSGAQLVPEVRVKWAHEFGDVDRVVDAAFVGTPQAFRVTGRRVNRDTALVRAGVSGTSRRDTEFGLNYVGDLSDGQTVHGVVASATYRW